MNIKKVNFARYIFSVYRLKNKKASCCARYIYGSLGLESVIQLPLPDTSSVPSGTNHKSKLQRPNKPQTHRAQITKASWHARTNLKPIGHKSQKQSTAPDIPQTTSVDNHQNPETKPTNYHIRPSTRINCTIWTRRRYCYEPRIYI